MAIFDIHYFLYSANFVHPMLWFCLMLNGSLLPLTLCCCLQFVFHDYNKSGCHLIFLQNISWISNHYIVLVIQFFFTDQFCIEYTFRAKSKTIIRANILFIYFSFKNNKPRSIWNVFGLVSVFLSVQQPICTNQSLYKHFLCLHLSLLRVHWWNWSLLANVQSYFNLLCQSNALQQLKEC